MIQTLIILTVSAISLVAFVILLACFVLSSVAAKEPEDGADRDAGIVE